MYCSYFPQCSIFQTSQKPWLEPTVLNSFWRKKSQSGFRVGQRLYSSQCSMILAAVSGHSSILNLYLIECLEWFGIWPVLDWFSSYLWNRTFSVTIGECRSSTESLTCGVPLGSVLGPLPLSISTSLLWHIIHRRNISFHFYVGNIQLYFSFDLTGNNQLFTHQAYFN